MQGLVVSMNDIVISCPMLCTFQHVPKRILMRCTLCRPCSNSAMKYADKPCLGQRKVVDGKVKASSPCL